MEDKKLSKEQIQDAEEQIEEAMAEVETGNLITDNILTFTFDEVEYKVIRPTFSKRVELREKMSKKKLDMILGDTYLPISLLKEKWLAKGIDINKLEEKMKSLNKDKEKYQNSLGKLLTEDNERDNLESYKDRIKGIDEDINKLAFQIMGCLDISLESQLENYGFSYLAYLISEKKIGDNWVNAFDTYEDFVNFDDDRLINKLCLYTSLVGRDEVQV